MMNEKELSLPRTKPFNIFEKSSEYDQNTYMGRFMTMIKTQNPFNFFLPHSKIVKAKEFIEEEKRLAHEGKLPYDYYDNKKVKEIRKAQNILESAVHPDTGEYILRPFRLCGYAPMSIPTLFGFLLSPPTTFNIVFWQWANQTLNAGVNYSNRNASSNLGVGGIIAAYTSACCASVGIGLGMKKVLEPYQNKFKGPGKLFINFLISLAAVGSAGFTNLLIMRSKEMKEGIVLRDHEGVERGKSVL